MIRKFENTDRESNYSKAELDQESRNHHCSTPHRGETIDGSAICSGFIYQGKICLFRN